MTGWDEILAAVGSVLAGEREDAERLLLTCWQGTRAEHHAQRCILAHYLADLQRSVTQEVRWDERALAAHAHLRDHDLTAVGLTSARALAPSLHLNLGDAYLRLGRVEDARRQADAGRAASDSLDEDGYGRWVRRGLTNLTQRIEALAGRTC
ncbi:hypothetical protein [Ruania halotolerans]|uniref:hypothetical protein n=1 Tax=Ruania halotolerans TaxID=2897773 RepID=UPI001E365B61|nr:hypothetical protein [Ruania halotolerans]UFU06850.1 hypothetical protein LQF10_01675 [Ruania halotolerans]